MSVLRYLCMKLFRSMWKYRVAPFFLTLAEIKMLNQTRTAIRRNLTQSRQNAGIIGTSHQPVSRVEKPHIEDFLSSWAFFLHLKKEEIDLKRNENRTNNVRRHRNVRFPREPLPKDQQDMKAWKSKTEEKRFLRISTKLLLYALCEWTKAHEIPFWYSLYRSLHSPSL